MAESLRLAYRSSYQPGYRDDNDGLRVALVSFESRMLIVEPLGEVRSEPAGQRP
jgi:hypothetical protein